MTVPDLQRRTGALFALGAYLWWGFAPLYFVYVSFATPVEIVAHRVLWSVPLLTLILVVRNQLGLVRTLRREQIAGLALSSALIAVNWGVFVWAVLNDRMLETSLGYYINPLVTIVLGLGFLGERLNRVQTIAVALAALGVVNELVRVGVLPWAALVLAVSFAFYGLARKQVGVGAALGLWTETLLIAPFALGFLVAFSDTAQRTTGELSALALGGIVTIVPLLFFAGAATRLPLSLLGFFQYLAPSITLLLAVFVMGEPFGPVRAVTFAFIWTALALLSAAELREVRRRRRPAAST